MKRFVRRYTPYFLMFIALLGILALWGCPKKADVTATPEPPTEEARPVEQAPVPQPEKAEPPQDQEIQEKTAASDDRGLQPVYFDFDQSLIRPEAAEILKANADWLKANPQVRVRIEGNCDERGTIEYNQALGQRRAASAKKYLTDLGVSAQRISLISYGKEKPGCADSTESCWEKNRRDDFVVVTD